MIAGESSKNAELLGKFEYSKSSVFAFADELKWLPWITGKMSISGICP
ncbi:hypothetical protein LRU_01086 [Ligilactobacillus ruminis SPM0211]|uniref:Uncharacterized protein n=1 Tax=Ligilactobacillus ruminis SPM0211 TaxID=1040964 RepID=F7R0J6_9LACO|nr:hypothetical protein LRU_01086 [Ligilactobacillus ruminis SPM0211]